MKLEGKVAIVTGAASGIGRASAVLFAAEGAAVALVDRDEHGLGECQAAIESGGGRAAAFVVADVGTPGTAESVAAEAQRRWGGIHVLMTAAGHSCGGTVETTSAEDWEAVYRTNVGGTWLWAKAVIPLMRRAGGGAIVTVASQLALAGGRESSAYIAAKGAVISLTRTMALDFAKDGIRVNALAPGPIETPMLARSFARQLDPDAARQQARLRNPLGRFGIPEEVAKGARYLASADSSFVTGAILPIDGGWLAA
ncbi:MAG TPA: SDR family oxidoreductase [Beijerinckiaceae bacterium]|nr:SDR family oxidoreductase [Beijerinckiaceae bacterium]